MAASRSGGDSGPRYAPSEPTLAKPWKELIDGATGNHYFWNPNTGVTQYHRPASSRHRHRHENPPTSARGHGSVEACRRQHQQAHKVTPATEKRKKRGRGVSPDFIPAVRKKSGSSSRDWSTLPNEIWRLILTKLPLEDYIRCAVVCSWLRSIARDLKQCSSLPRVPWLIESDKRSRKGYLKLFDMASNKNHKVHLPELFDSCILGSSEGWLIVADKKTADLRLLNPFSREQIHLPPTTTFPGIVDYRLNLRGQVKRYYIQSEEEVTKRQPRHVLGHFGHATLVSSKCGYIVVVHYGSESGIAFARSGDKVWTALQKIPNELKTSMFFNDLLYTMDPYGKVFSFDFRSGGSPPPPVQVAPDVLKDFTGPIEDNFLGVLPGSGKLVLVRISYSYHSADTGFRKTFRTFMLDHAAEKWIDVSGTLNGHSMFLTIGLMQEFFSNTVCISAKDFPGQIKGNCIYSVIIGPLQVWDNEDQKFTRYHPTPENSDGNRYIPIWISPVLTSLNGRGA